MWFKNLMVFEFDANWDFDEESLEEKLFERRLRACPKHAFFTQGWASPLKGFEEERHSFHVEQLCLLNLVKETRILPNSVVQKEVMERANQFEEENAKRAGPALRKQFKEEVEFELLPKAFVTEKKTTLYIDTKNKRVLIDTSSGAVASNVIGELVKTIGTLNLAPFKVSEGLDEIFASWIRNPNAIPEGLELGKQCKLTSLKEGKSAYQCRDLEYHLEDVEGLLDNGLAITELELIWQDRLSFILTHQFELKRIKYLDSIEETVKEHSDLEDPRRIFYANLSLMNDNFSTLINFFVQTFGGQDRNVIPQKITNSETMVA